MPLTVSRTNVLLAVAITVIAGAVYFGRDQPLGPAYVALGNLTYDITPLSAPTATGLHLRIQAALVGAPLIGGILRRALLIGNGLLALRVLAAQLDPGTEMVYFPVERVTPDVAAAHAQAYIDSNVGDALLHGFPHATTAAIFNSIEAYAAAYKAGTTTPTAVTARLLDALRLDGPIKSLGAFANIDVSGAVAGAAASTARFAARAPLSVFDGVPVAVKESIDVTGLPTGFGRKPGPHNAIATRDDPIVARLRQAGAIIIGTTVMTEFGTSPLGYNSHYRGPFNPYNTSHYSGGSSSGSAVAVAAGLVPVAIGFDGGGSIRLPCAFSGCFGLSPTYGSIPFEGNGVMSVVHGGPLAATARDAALTFALLAEPLSGNAFTTRYGAVLPPKPHLARFMDLNSLKGLRVGVFAAHFDDPRNDAVVTAACHGALNHLVGLGVEVVLIALPNMMALSLAHGLSITAEFAAMQDADYWAAGLDLEPSTRIALGLGMAVSSTELLSAQRLRGWAMAYWRNISTIHTLDAYVSPTVGMTAPHLGADVMECGESNPGLVLQIMKYVFLANFLGNPGLAVPVGYSQNLPISLHFMGNHWGDAVLLRLAHALEHQFLMREKPAVFVDLLNKKN